MAEVLSAHPPDGQPYFSTSPLRRSSPSQSSFASPSAASLYSGSRPANYAQETLGARGGFLSRSLPSSPHSSHTDLVRTSSLIASKPSSLALHAGMVDHQEIGLPAYADDNSEDEDSDIEAPAGSPVRSPNKIHPPSPPRSPSPSTISGTPEVVPVSEDDTAIRHEPSQHVDYLSHDWQEEDIWSSWRHIVSKRKVYGQRSRLENASWRSWAKAKYKLRTISPETLNWLKDCDVTWLYGPLQPASRAYSQNTSEPASQLSKSNSFIIHKKPILKKRSMSEAMLIKSISSSSLVKQAAAAVQAQQQNSHNNRIRHRPALGRAISDFVTSSIPTRTASREPTDYFSSTSTSGLVTPDHGERKHIRFDDKVEQCIAVDCKEDDYDFDEDEWAVQDDDDSSDDGMVMMKRSDKKRMLSRNHSRHSFSGESKTIAKLPSTTLKYRTDSPDMHDPPPTHSLGYYRPSKLSPSPSQETLRPSNPATNFLLAEEDDDDDEDITWEPSGAFANRRDSMAITHERNAGSSSKEDAQDASGGLRRTSSGMFMPYEEDEDERVSTGLIGKVVDTVNTARDIAHVIWNVGWRK